MKHKIEIAPNLAIYIDGERVIGSKPYGMFLTTIMIVSDDDLKRLADRCFEVISDRKTESNSEKSNNCETCRHYKLACELFSEICKYEPKDEPLTADYCDTCDHKECEYCIADSSNPYCVPSNYHKVEDESTISKMEQVDKPQIYGNEYNCIMTLFGDCSYAETGCGSCEIVEKVRKALNKYESE